MTDRDNKGQLSRRELLYLSAAGLASNLTLPTFALTENPAQHTDPHSTTDLYSTVLKTWCDGLLAHQVTAITDPALHGALLCPACSIIHGRCGDAIYPLLRVAHDTGNSKYLNAALLVYDWTERQVSREDGSWINDVTLSSWKGITVFHTITLGEAIHHHGSLLDLTTRQQWTTRLSRAAKFLDGFITIQTGNINYPITASYCFALCGKVLGEQRYLDRARALAHESLNYFTPNRLIFGEGHPLEQITAKGCHPVDLGYNVEESIPALVLYSLQTDDKQILDRVVSSMRAHMEFMLPDGAWDNSWGTRNYKWTWWGSRTSDGCHSAYVLLSDHDPRFLEVARRNLELMRKCTHNGLLYGGPDYFIHGDQPCIHHTFTHAKALATVLDRTKQLEPSVAITLPRDEAYGVKTFPEIGTSLIAIGDWRATVTEYDWEYVEHVQAASATGGGHATGGALSLLYHYKLGPVLTASMTQYQLIELSNQQVFNNAPHMTLTPRIECTAEQIFTSLSDNEASLTKIATPDEIVFEARGRLLSASHQPMPEGGARYRLVYRFTAAGMEISATIESSATHSIPARLIVPVIARSDDQADIAADGSVEIRRKTGDIAATVSTGQSFQPLPRERTFNLVPGFECVPLEILLKPQEKVCLRIEARLR